jgi:hypothetical protein
VACIYITFSILCFFIWNLFFKFDEEETFCSLLKLILRVRLHLIARSLDIRKHLARWGRNKKKLRINARWKKKSLCRASHHRVLETICRVARRHKSKTEKMLIRILWSHKTKKKYFWAGVWIPFQRLIDFILHHV